MGSPGTLDSQLIKLLKTAKLPHVRLRVLPFSSGAHTGIDGSYTIFRFDAGEPIVAVEPMTTSVYPGGDDHVGQYDSAFSRVLSQALGPAESHKSSKT
ncbi:Scr1 family TA system antitoxin-like transcriptional regulator [Streptomyces orinoci]|uniref:Scr1 family TA system antitoxin-like transcriptional regulator n=1 Tax=Streptomyces orinoci TaxID=67339 RepID=A0ABV3K7J6_STRON|nr:Scr1 family TA system antitoxin-like transcriptional regulator [Streptomyces orinoci]